jgi:hypothetical protein
LNEQESSCWTIEKDSITNKCFLRGYVADEHIGRADYAQIKAVFNDMGDAKVMSIDLPIGKNHIENLPHYGNVKIYIGFQHS